jgi:hypothetical protein
MAGYVRYQVFDDATFRSTAEELVADPVIRDQVASDLVEALFTRVDVAARLEQRLPADQKGLAEPIAGAFRSVADSQAPKLLARPRAQEAWVNSVSIAQQQLERVLDGETTALDTQGGYLVLNLEPLVVQLGDRVAILGRLNAHLGQDRAVIRIMEVDSLQTAQNATSAFKFVAAWLWIVPLLLWAAAIWLARGRRREEVRAVAISIIAAGVLILLIRALGGRYIVDALVQAGSEDPAKHAWAIITALLADGGRTLVGLGLAALAGTWLVGPTRQAVAVRRRVAPYLIRPEYAFGGGAALLLLLVWWGPTEQTRRLGWIILLAVLLFSGIELLRRVTAREGAAEVPPAAHEPV